MVMRAAGAILLLACDPLAVPSSSAVARCAKPCAAGCPACLPSGYCSEVVRTAAELGLAPIPEGASWSVAVPGFPPGEPVSFSLHAGFDIAERSGHVPSWVNILVWSFDIAFLLGTIYDAFPVWATYQSHALAGDDGTLRVPLLLTTCRISQASVCSIDGASTLTATLANTRPWLEAPPCGP
jgi:hypothetical protein